MLKEYSDVFKGENPYQEGHTTSDWKNSTGQYSTHQGQSQ